MWVRHHGEVGDHLLVGGLVPLGQLDHAVQDEDAAVVRGLEHQHLLELGHALEQDLLHLQSRASNEDYAKFYHNLVDSSY